MIVGDTVQRVMVKDLRLGAVGLDVATAKWIKIKKNYRNSKQILKAASHLANTYGDLAKASGQELEVLNPELAVRETASPLIASSINEIKDAWEYAQACIQGDSAAPWSICIISAAPESISVDTIYDNAPTALDGHITKLSGDFKRKKDSICVANMSDVKGFDFSLVIIIGCGADILPPKGHCIKERWRDALRLYVAMTRARDAVRMTYHGKPSEFLTSMQEDVTWEEQEKEAALLV
jgi:superfamily I DNA/RNA helicase